jgi:acyl-CoA thioesterase
VTDKATEELTTAADLAGALDLQRVDENRYRGLNVGSPERDIVFGGQLAGQLGVAAARADGAKVVKSVHALFGKTAVKSRPLDFTVDFLHSGRSLSSASVTLRQDGAECARGLVLLTADDRDLIRHEAAIPDVPSPETLPPRADGFTGCDVRVVGGVDINDPDATGPAELFVWTRLPAAPDDITVSQGILSHASAGFLIGTAMRPHAGFGQGAAHDAFSTGILGHSMTFHEPFRASEWMLLANESVYAGNGRAYGRGHAFAADGRLIASFAQDEIIRHFPGGKPSAGKKATTL